MGETMTGRRVSLGALRWIALGVGVGLAALVMWALADDDATLDPALAELGPVSCSSEGAAGTVANTADETVTIVIQVEFFDDNEDFLQLGSVTYPGVGPGAQTAWAVPFRPDLLDNPDSLTAGCEASVPSMFRFGR